MGEVLDILQRLAARGPMTVEGWKAEVKPKLDSVPPGVTTPLVREVLDFWADPSVEWEFQAERWIVAFLRRHGYAVELGQTRSPSLIPRLRDASVAEPDPGFAALAAAVGDEISTARVAVVDTALDITHPLLAAKIATNAAEASGTPGVDDDGNGAVDDIQGFNFYADPDDANVMPTDGFDEHGTAVAGIALSGTDRLQLVPVRVAGRFETITAGVAGAEYAARSGAPVVNLSYTAGVDHLELVRRYPDTLFVLSAGNRFSRIGEGSWTAATHLAAHQPDNLVVVAAAMPSGALESGSNYGAPWVDVGAISPRLSAAPGADYTIFGMTSGAAPVVSNVAAKALLLAPSLKGPDLKRLIMETVDPREDWNGLVEAGGVVNEGRALHLAALIRLRLDGLAPDAAADRLGLTGVERVRLLGLLPEFLPV